MDLHTLTKTHGAETVAAAMGCTYAALAAKRSGRRPLTVDDLHRLSVAFPGFDVSATVKRIGARRMMLAGGSND